MSKPLALVTDDDPAVRNLIREMLACDGWDTLWACDGTEALERLEQSAVPVQLLVTDVRMPNTNGVELIKSVNNAYPHLPIMVVTAYSFEQTLPPEGFKGRMQLLPKPFSMKALLETAQALLNNSNPPAPTC
jgi:CheY-like chemotaxis protein